MDRGARSFALSLVLFLGVSELVAREPALVPDEIAPGVHILSSAHKMGAANMGWIELEDTVFLIDAGHPDHLPKLRQLIQKTTGKPIGRVLLTHAREAQIQSAKELASGGATILGHTKTLAALGEALPQTIKTVAIENSNTLREDGFEIVIRSLGHAAGPGNLTAALKKHRVLFAGELIQAAKPDFTRARTERWIAALEDLNATTYDHVVPGFGSPGTGELVEQQGRYVRELRRQVCYMVSQMKPGDFVCKEIRRLGLPGPLLHWKPYDDPNDGDILHLYGELTVPNAPFRTEPFDPADRRPRALCVTGDRVHYPAHIEDGLKSAFDAARMNARIAFDPRALSAENLAQVDLFVVLRDGTIWPESMTDSAHWLKKNQVDALRTFIEGGGGFLSLHNSTALWRDDYVELLGGKYDGHGPLERFRVRVTDKTHPITRSVEDFEVADEQHWPIVDTGRVRTFLGNINEDGRAGVAGFEHELGKGRICYLAPGHTREAMEHPMFQRLMANAMRWCVRREP